MSLSNILQGLSNASPEDIAKIGAVATAKNDQEKTVRAALLDTLSADELNKVRVSSGKKRGREKTDAEKVVRLCNRGCSALSAMATTIGVELSYQASPHFNDDEELQGVTFWAMGEGKAPQAFSCKPTEASKIGRAMSWLASSFLGQGDGPESDE
jgi:hypothetical protein